MKRIVLIAASAAAVVGLQACGGGGSESGKANHRIMEIEMVDIAFKPTTLSVTKGETLEFVFKNTGKVDHDALIGDRKAQDEHEAEMNDDKGHGGHGDDDKAVTVKPGKTGRLTYTFDRAGTVEIGCHQPGHYTAGMKVIVQVA